MLAAQSIDRAPTTYLNYRFKGNTTLLNELRPGMRLHGGVVGVTDFAAFVDVQVVRKGAGGRVRTTTTGHCNRNL